MSTVENCFDVNLRGRAKEMAQNGEFPEGKFESLLCEPRESRGAQRSGAFPEGKFESLLCPSHGLKCHLEEHEFIK
ncbi:MAG: hypothetical protein HFE62_03845 [Firmicutes bacterium]|nr:hypothetical protein [Bacillota bacterium]